MKVYTFPDGRTGTKKEIKALLSYLDKDGRWTPGRTIVTDTREGHHYMYHIDHINDMRAFITS